MRSRLRPAGSRADSTVAPAAVPRLFRWLARPPSRLENYLRIYLAAESFRLLADPTRIKILWVLLQGESSVASLAELVGAAPTAVSQHLAKLRLAGLVRGRRGPCRGRHRAQLTALPGVGEGEPGSGGRFRTTAHRTRSLRRAVPPQPGGNISSRWSPRVSAPCVVIRSTRAGPYCKVVAVVCMRKRSRPSCGGRPGGRCCLRWGAGPSIVT